jgi:cation:H+ antiporter
VRGGIGLSRAFGLSPLLIGLLVVSTGTSAPEMVIALQSAFHGAPGLAVGNVAGSNIVNIMLILGLGALMRPIPTSPKIVMRDGGALIVSTLAFAVMLTVGVITRRNGWLLLGGFAVYVVICFITDRRRPPPLCGTEARARARGLGTASAAASVIALIFGSACLYFGGEYVVDGGVAVARLYHVPPVVVGLTLVAVGSSLPELATTIAASIRGETALAIGNLIGSNIFNILLVLGITASVHPLNVANTVTAVDIGVMVGAAVLLPLMLASRWRLTRPQGALLVIGYGAYLVYLAWQHGYLPAHFG